jgi:putative acetyltransferase
MFEIRPATNADQTQIIALIDQVLQEYDDRICLDNAEADLCDIKSSFVDLGGAFWVATNKGTDAVPAIIGSHAALPHPERPNLCNLKRLYVAKSYRGTGVAKQLMEVAIAWAVDEGFQSIEFWSDTRFTRAHRFFEKMGFKATGEIRHMTDSHEPYSEYFYSLKLHP